MKSSVNFENCELKDYYNQIVCEINNEEND